MVSALSGSHPTLNLGRAASGDLSQPFQATTRFDVGPLGDGNAWRVTGRAIPTGNIAAIGRARAGIEFPTCTSHPDYTVFVHRGERGALKASVDETTGQRRRYGLENARAGDDYPTDVPPRHFAVLVDLNGAGANGAPRPGQFRLPVSKIQKLEQAVAGTDFPQLSPPAPGVPMPRIERDFAVAVLGPHERVRL